MKRVCDFFRKYSHIWLLSYFFIYIPWFCYLEKTVTRDYHLMHAPLDSLIPFNEYFIIPYLLWFAFVGVTLIYFLIKSKEDYYRMCTFLFSGMTISLIICTFFENGTNLRPILDPDKIFLLLPWLLCTVPIPVQTYFRASMYTIPSVPILPSIKALCFREKLP